MAELEIIGFIAGFLVAFALLPQLIKTFKTKSAKDISVHWTLIFIVGLLLWVIYAYVNNIVPLLVFTIVEFSMASSLFIFKIVYK